MWRQGATKSSAVASAVFVVTPVKRPLPTTIEDHIRWLPARGPSRRDFTLQRLAAADERQARHNAFVARHDRAARQFLPVEFADTLGPRADDAVDRDRRWAICALLAAARTAAADGAGREAPPSGHEQHDRSEGGRARVANDVSRAVLRLWRDGGATADERIGRALDLVSTAGLWSAIGGGEAGALRSAVLCLTS